MSCSCGGWDVGCVVLVAGILKLCSGSRAATVGILAVLQ